MENAHQGEDSWQQAILPETTSTTDTVSSHMHILYVAIFFTLRINHNSIQLKSPCLFPVKRDLCGFFKVQEMQIRIFVMLL